MRSRRIYLDYAATTPPDPRVVEEMMRHYKGTFGNASSLHWEGSHAKEVLSGSRRIIAKSMGVSPEEIIFTGSGTEANNLALKGIAFANRHKGNHIVVSSIEHDCILNTCRWLEDQGFIISYVPVGSDGIIDPNEVRKFITSKTILVSVMHVNNEIGTIQPLEEIGTILQKYEIPFHTDACQSFGKIPLMAGKMKLDLITINAHKIYGPKGVGALYVRNGLHLDPLLHGGGQEQGIRSSTENIPAIAGFATAALICHQEMETEMVRLQELSCQLKEVLLNSHEDIYFNGDQERRLPGILNFCLSGREGESIRLMLMLDELGIAVSTGSACSNNQENSASHVLQAIGLNPFEARGAIRISLGRNTTYAETQDFVKAFNQTVSNLNPIFS